MLHPRVGDANVELDQSGCIRCNKMPSSKVQMESDLDFPLQ